MNDDKVAAMKFDAETASGASSQGTTREGASPHAFKGASRRAAAVGVYDRPAQRARLSLPLVVILILSALVSVVAAARFLF